MSLRRVLLPTPPAMSKAERRQQFEALVKAEDETKRQQEMEQRKSSYLEQLEAQAMSEYINQSNNDAKYGYTSSGLAFSYCTVFL